MHVAVFADIEGSFGIWRMRQCRMGTPEWQYGRACLTEDVNHVVQGAFDGGFVEPQRDEAAGLVLWVAEAERVAFESRPVGAERIGRHAEHEHAGAFQPVLDLRRDAVAGLDLPVVKPHPQPIAPQPLGDVANGVLVFGAVAQKNVELEILSHASPVQIR